jgi:hypothetical protein
MTNDDGAFASPRSSADGIPRGSLGMRNLSAVSSNRVCSRSDCPIRLGCSASHCKLGLDLLIDNERRYCRQILIAI